MRRLALAGVALIAFCAPARAQMPVIDQQSIWYQTQQLAKQIQTYSVQLQQLQTAVSMAQSFIQNPNLGSLMGLLNAVGIQNPLPINPWAIQGVISGASSGNYLGVLGSLGSLTNGTYNANHVYTPTPDTSNMTNLTALVNNANGIAGVQGTAMTIYQQIASQYPVVQSLQQQALSASTPAQRESIMAQLQAQIAQSQMLLTQLQAAALLAYAQQGSQAQRDSEKLDCDIDATLHSAAANGVNGLPVSGSGSCASGATGGSDLLSASSIAGTSGGSGPLLGADGGTTTSGSTTDGSSSAGTSAGSASGAGSGSTALNTMLAQPWGSAAANNAQSMGVNPSALAATCVLESGCQNIGGSGSAQGAFQMMPATYTASLNAALTNNPSLASSAISGAAGMTDPATQSIAASQYLLQGAQALQTNGISNPTVLDVRGYYNFGPQGGVALATAQDSAPMAQVLNMYTPSQLAANGITPGETVGQWKAAVSAKIGDASGQPVLMAQGT